MFNRLAVVRSLLLRLFSTAVILTPNLRHSTRSTNCVARAMEASFEKSLSLLCLSLSLIYLSIYLSISHSHHQQPHRPAHHIISGTAEHRTEWEHQGGQEGHAVSPESLRLVGWLSKRSVSVNVGLMNIMARDPPGGEFPLLLRLQIY